MKRARCVSQAAVFCLAAAMLAGAESVGAEPSSAGTELPTTGPAALIGKHFVYKSTNRDLYLDASFTETSVTARCVTPDGQTHRSFAGDLAPKDPFGYAAIGSSLFSGAMEGTVRYSFDAEGRWASTLWHPHGKQAQWTRWVRVKAVGANDTETGEASLKEAQQ